LSLRSEDLDSVGELYTEDDFRQLVVSIEATPTFLGGLGELKDHGERGLVGETSLGAHRAVADGRERAFDDVGRAQMLPMLGGEVVEGQQRVAILGQALDRLVVFDARGLPSGPEMLSYEIALPLPVDTGQVDRALTFDEPDHLRNCVFWRYRDHHVHVVGHEMPLLDLALLLQSQFTEHFPEVLSQLPVQRLSAAFWNEHDVVFALPLRVA